MEGKFYYDMAMEGVSENWIDIIDDENFCECLSDIEGEDICPAPKDILNAFKLTKFEDVKVVLIGQDPYPNKSNACGLCFSTPYDLQKIPQSLHRIYDALIVSGYLSKKPTHGCLDNWAKQGVLLLNTAFTCKTGKSDSHRNVWVKYTTNLISKICLQKPQLIFMLWGNNAHKLEPVIKKTSPNHKILKWGHPSPMSSANQSDNPRNFKYCNHFKEINEILDVPIIWDPDYDPYAKNVLFTDGHCRRNGQPDSRGGWGIYAPPTFMGYMTNITFSKHGPVDGEQTNNRAELQAVREALQLVVNNKLHTEPTIIVTDSQYVRGVITDWMWRDNWIETHKNPDIIGDIKKLLTCMQHPELVKSANHMLFYYGAVTPKDWPGTTVIWRAAAHDVKMPDDQYEKELYIGNDTADKLSRLETADES